MFFHQQWALAIERCLGNLINSFCCHDHHDERVLEGIFERVCDRSRPSIITSKFKVSNSSYFTVSINIKLIWTLSGCCIQYFKL
jgi:hypothetical protein